MIALVEPGIKYLLRDPDAFESGIEARSFLFADANQDNTSGHAVAAAAVRIPRRSSTRRALVNQPGHSFDAPRPAGRSIETLTFRSPLAGCNFRIIGLESGPRGPYYY